MVHAILDPAISPPPPHIHTRARAHTHTYTPTHTHNLMPPNHPHSDICSSMRRKHVMGNKGKHFSQSQLPQKKGVRSASDRALPVYSYDGKRVLTLLGCYYLPDMNTVTIAFNYAFSNEMPRSFQI